MPKSVLITGGAGFIGSALARRLVGRGWSCIVLDSLSPQIHGPDTDPMTVAERCGPGVTFRRGDVRQRADIEAAIANVDVIVHLAAETGTGQSMYQLDRYVSVNSQGTATLLDLLVNYRHKVKKVIVASSRSVYGEGKYYCGEHGVVFPLSRSTEDLQKGIFEPRCPVCHTPVEALATDETSPAHPGSIYAVTKLNQEQLVLCCCRSIGLPAVALRYQNVFGPGQSLKNPYTGIFSIFSTAILAGKPINIFEDGKESRDFVYIDDVAEATARAVEADIYDVTINVGSGQATSVLEVAETLASAYGMPSRLQITGDFRAGDIRHNRADISRLEQLLDFKPCWSFAQGTQAFANWVKGQTIGDSQYQQSLDEMKQRNLFYSAGDRT